MKKTSSSLLAGFLMGVIGLTSFQVATLGAGKLAVQDPGNVVGTGDKAWSYLLLEGEDYVSEVNDAEGVGFTRVDASGSVTNILGNPVLGTNTKASKKGALWTQTAFGQHIDKVTYQVQFAKAGTYYVYMRFTMFDNGGNTTYLNEDSFFLPPDFGKDPQTDWPLSDRGGYVEGCCDGGFLTIKEDGVPVNHGPGDDAGRAFWEGNFHWNELLSSQFLNPDTQGEPRLRFKYVVTDAQVGKPLDWTVSYREGGVTIDAWLFSTSPTLMDDYSQDELDKNLMAPEKLTVQDPANIVGTGDKAWSFLLLEGEDYDSEFNDALGVGFTRVDNSASITSSLGNPVLGKDTKASKKGALFTQTAFGQHIDKVTYKVQFAKAGTYYVYMRFTMFDNAGNTTYLNEDSFFLPPDFGKDPQTDWPLSDRGGYAEGCCDGGFLTIKEDGVPVNHGPGDDAGRAFWEGNFHWNELLSSQFLNPDTQGEPRLRFKYVVTDAQVGKPLDWTVSYREGGLTIDAWLFSTSPTLMDDYSQADLDSILINPAKVTVQGPANVVGAGADAWSYLFLEGEDYASEFNDAEGVGFTRVDNSGSLTNALGNFVLAKDTTASKKGALWTQTPFGQHIDKVTYKVQFSRAGTYYMYMRFTMFDNGGNTTYLNEDSFFLPPDFGKDPQTDWPLSDRGGYAEGCCDGGFLTIKEAGVPVNHGPGDDAGRAFWEGNFHWNELLSSQFLNPDTQGEPRLRFKYVVTDAQVGKPLDWTVSYREGGITIDLWMFSTNPNLMETYGDADFDKILAGGVATPRPKLTVSVAGKNATLAWPTGGSFVLESTGTLTSPTWAAVATPPVVAAGQNTVTVDVSTGVRFYRLILN